MVVKGMEGGIACYQAVAKDFTPITVSADFGALARLESMNSKVATTVTESAKGDCKVAKAA
ncbi:hypothetical protein [Geomonas sp.]|uniref:hypothetical protein n=1 Tax=Geomonas sp. TaxID=2651584 RepID=UPI002B49687C|nr:hypothetical protein [Geomonas sp.]HJV33516.1 hypothetical protein [Geomonas sp.]